MRAAILFVVAACMIHGGVDAANSYVYDNTLLSPFQDWSWGNGVNRVCTTPTNGGSTYSVSFSPNSWGALYFHATDYISTSTFSGLEFWAYRPSNSSTNIIFNMIVDGSSGAVITGPTKTVTSLMGGSWAENTWIKGTVLFSDFPTGTYDGFFFQDNSGGSSNALVYFDNIALVTGGSSSNATTTTAPSVAPTQRATTTTTAPTTTKAPTTTTKVPTTTTTQKSNATTTTAKPTTTAAPTTTTSKPATTTTSSGGTQTGDIDPDVLALYNSVTAGSATYYGAYSNGGACMLDPTPAAGSGCKLTVAIANYMGSKTCGMCIEVKGLGTGSGDMTFAPNGTRIVFVNDQCPNCPTGLLDFGLTGDGIWDITWKAVPCPVTSNIQYVFKSGSSQYWLGLQARNTVHPVYKFAIKVGGVWTYLPRMDYNYFVQSFSSLQFPIQIQLTSVKGEVITDTIQSVQNGVIIQGNVQFTA